MLRAVIALVAVVGIAYGANLALTGSGGSKNFEFGQGLVKISAYDLSNKIIYFF